MEVFARVVDPQDVEIEVTIKMTAQHWEALCKDIDGKWPGADLARKMREVIYKLKRDSFAVDEP